MQFGRNFEGRLWLKKDYFTDDDDDYYYFNLLRTQKQFRTL